MVATALGVSVQKTALEIYASTTLKLIESGAQTNSQQGQNTTLRTEALNERGIAKNLQVTA